jgi:hypothetical protein
MYDFFLLAIQQMRLINFISCTYDCSPPGLRTFPLVTTFHTALLLRFRHCHLLCIVRPFAYNSQNSIPTDKYTQPIHSLDSLNTNNVRIRRRLPLLRPLGTTTLHKRTLHPLSHSVRPHPPLRLQRNKRHGQQQVPLFILQACLHRQLGTRY